MNEQPTKRPLDETVKKWLEIATDVASLALTVLIGVQLLKHVFGFDLLDWIGAQIHRQRVRLAVRAWEREHRNDGANSPE